MGLGPIPSTGIFEVVLDLIVQIDETEIFWWGQSWQGAELGLDFCLPGLPIYLRYHSSHKEVLLSSEILMEPLAVAPGLLFILHH